MPFITSILISIHSMRFSSDNLKFRELLTSLRIAVALDFEDVEANSLGQGTAFTDSDDITSLNTNESGRAMGGNVLVSLFVTVILLDVVQVFTTNDNGAFHFGGNNLTSKNTSTDGYVTSEGAFLINVSSSDGFLGSLETQTDVLVPARTFTLWDNALVVHEDGVLLLERFMMGLKGGNEEEENRK